MSRAERAGIPPTLPSSLSVAVGLRTTFPTGHRGLDVAVNGHNVWRDVSCFGGGHRSSRIVSLIRRCFVFVTGSHHQVEVRGKSARTFPCEALRLHAVVLADHHWSEPNYGSKQRASYAPWKLIPLAKPRTLVCFASVYPEMIACRLLGCCFFFKRTFLMATQPQSQRQDGERHVSFPSF